MTLCDRCGEESKPLTEIKDEFGGISVCNSCFKEINDAYFSFTEKHIIPMLKLRTEHVKEIVKGFKLVD